MKPVRMVLLGPPAAGKGTQGQLMRARWKVPVTSVGEMLRQEVAMKTATGREAAAFQTMSRWAAWKDGWKATWTPSYLMAFREALARAGLWTKFWACGMRR
jgi:adenylate kinase family enzyme